ncbi:MAG: beta-ketoacyl-[acyl-carrier-protein] synthase family protein [Gammaproteobacteria bacterium]|nr:beta-ketoacyl-[acyl-carrier-protein] synthase family protein [Gammaproteobacteria bacterium]MDH5592808.1 beta-ketoacyl-[acyl-carrier-protein] synthase family protein [Gammaproteobacteria bacterium]
MISPLVSIKNMGVICSLGDNKQDVLDGLLSGSVDGMKQTEPLIKGKRMYVGKVDSTLLSVPTNLIDYNCRNNKFIVAAYEQIRDDIEQAKIKFGSDRVGVIIGTSTSGISEGEKAVEWQLRENALPTGYNYRQQEIGSPAEFLAKLAGISGPAYTVSAACASSTKAFAPAKRLIETGVIDACITGGSDSLCRLTLNGFDSLDSVSEQICNPFSRNRNGISIGEGAALFLLQKGEGETLLLGVGESSDAHHISAPHPEGTGAEMAMASALSDAGLKPEDIGYLNLHGTATPLNDLMESKAVGRIFGKNVPCSSTKPLTGHALGAAGALEAGFCWLVLSKMNKQKKLPPHCWDGEKDDELFQVNLVDKNACLESSVLMSNSFAFGGSNASVIIGSK